MFMSVVDELRHDAIYPELAGQRALVTGVSGAFGVDISRAFAEHAARLVLHTPSSCEQIHELASLLVQDASDLKLFETPLTDGDAATAFLQGPAQKAFGGLDVVVNLIRIDRSDLVGRIGLEEIEDLIAEKLVPATLIGRVAANRMRLTLTDGLILNVIATPRDQTPHEMALVDMIRATLATVTRQEAQNWADKGIRINAVGPSTLADELMGSRDMLGGEADVAALALYLASDRGKGLSGHVFDAKNLGGL